MHAVWTLAHWNNKWRVKRVLVLHLNPHLGMIHLHVPLFFDDQGNVACRVSTAMMGCCQWAKSGIQLPLKCGYIYSCDLTQCWWQCWLDNEHRVWWAWSGFSCTDSLLKTAANQIPYESQKIVELTSTRHQRPVAHQPFFYFTRKVFFWTFP